MIKKNKELAISQMLFHLQTSYLVPRYNPKGTSNENSADDLDPRSRSKVKVNFSQKWVKTKELVISWRLFHLLVNNSYLVQRYNPMRRIQWINCRWPKVKVTGQGQISKNWPKSRNYKYTDFILGTKVQPNKAHSITQVSMTLTFGQGQRSRSNFPKNE